MRAAASLARGDCGWNCIRTTTRLGKGKYVMRVKASALEISWAGEPKGITSTVDREALLKHLDGSLFPSRAMQAFGGSCERDTRLAGPQLDRVIGRSAAESRPRPNRNIRSDVDGCGRRPKGRRAS